MKIPVFFQEAMNCASNNSYSPSAGKPKLAVEDWLANEAIAPHIEIVPFDPVTQQQLCQVHSKAFVEGVASGEIKNGFGNTSPEVYQSLLHTNGSMVAAALHVLEHGGLAVSPTSGFHHARRTAASGFCTFNGLIVTAMEVINKIPDARILIVDMDAHDGDGTRSLIGDHSLHKHILHITSGQDYETPAEAMKCCDIMYLIDRCQKKWGDSPHIILFQAGADIWEFDDLGAGILSAEQMQKRDFKIFKLAQEWPVPIVTNLAGGYSRDSNGSIEPVLKLHRQTMLEAVKRFCKQEGPT